MSFLRSLRGALLLCATIGALAAVALTTASAAPLTPTPRQVTVTTGGKNQNASVNKNGKLIVFQSNSNDFGASTFDSEGFGNDFTLAGATHPDPSCIGCANTDGNGELYLWRLKKSKTGAPANSVQQITNTTGGGFSANQFPDMAQKGTFFAWDSDADHTGANADGNREIFLYDIAAGSISQVTATTGGGNTANRSVSLSDDAKLLTFDSSRDYAGVNGCTLPDGATPCNNADGNSEVMTYDRVASKLTQVTSTTTSGASANLRARISGEGKFLTFQSTRSFAGPLPGGSTCVLANQTSPCSNDGNGEIMLFDSVKNRFIQVTNTVIGGPCGGSNPNERAEISKSGKYVTWQSKCEAQLNPTTCGACDGNDEAFIYETKKKTLLQMTISNGGFNRVPRISGAGNYIAFESNRNLKNLNAGNKPLLFIIKRNTKPPKNGVSSQGQLLQDPATPLTQNLGAAVVTINFSGGFNTSVEQFGVSGNGRFYAFDNGKGGVGRPNQEVWLVDRKK